MRCTLISVTFGPALPCKGTEAEQTIFNAPPMTPLLRTAFISIGLVASTAAFAQTGSAESTTEKFSTLLYYIENMYVDSVNSTELVETAIRNMLEDLDPHSLYIPPEEVQAANEPLNGSFDGIGIQFNILRDTIFVVAPISGGPSEALGIRSGDKIVEVDGESVAGIEITNRMVMDYLKGPKGTKVKVGIKRAGVKKILDFNITRDKIPIYSVDAHFMVDDKVGYVKVNRFARTTLEELRAALGNLKRAGMEDLILDLQGNGGGLLQAAVQMADEFLSDDKLIVYMEGRSYPRDDRNARREGLHEKGRLVVLIDEGSASASEIVSGAVQDWDRGLIVGRRSFGKGLVQRPVPLPDGAAVRLTVQKYFTPSGRCIQKSYEEGVEAYRSEKYERYESGEVYSLENLDLPDSLRFETKVKGRSVYGGGGILPDVFVPVDTTYSSDFFSNVLRKGLTNQFVLEYVDANRGVMKQNYPEADDFFRNFSVSQDMEDAFLAFVAKNEVEFNAEQYAVSREAMLIRMKAFVGRNLFDQNMFYRVISALNPAFRKANEVLNDGTFRKMNLAHSQF